MTVSTTVRTAGPYLGTGSVSVYTFAFKVFLTTDVLVQFVSALGVLSTGTLGTDYSVSLNTNQDTNPGGNIILTLPLASGATLTIGSQVPLTQGVVLTNPGGFYPQIISDALDKVTILIQQALTSIGGALRIPEIGSSATILPPAAQRANQLLSFDANGNPITVAAAAQSATSVALALAAYQVQLASAVGAAQLGFTQSGTLPVVLTLQDKVRQVINIDDYKNAAGLAPGQGGDDTQSLTNACLATIRNGGFGVVELSAGKVYNIAGNWTLDGALGLIIRGKNGGNVGNLSGASSGGAATLNFTVATGDCMRFTGIAYHAAGIRLENLMLVGATTGNTLSYDNCSQISYSNVTVTNSGGNSVSTGNGIRYSNCYYVDCSLLKVWKSGTLYTVGTGITIDKGGLASFLGGLFNFTASTSVYGFYNGYSIGNPTPGATANDNYAAINIVGSELNGCSQGINLLYGVRGANIIGNYIEGCLVAGIVLANQPRSINVWGNFFNNSTASSADVVLGLTGSGTSYTQFYDVDIRGNHFLGVNKFGILAANAGPGASYNAEGNFFSLAVAGAVAISSTQSSLGNLRATTRNNDFYGFAAGAAMAGFYTTQYENFEYNAAGALIGAWRQASVVLNPFVGNTPMQGNDPDTYTVTNNSAGARLINAPGVFSRNQRRYVTVTAASTQSLLIYNSSATTLLATVPAGKCAVVWNDGTNEYASVMP